MVPAGRTDLLLLLPTAFGRSRARTAGHDILIVDICDDGRQRQHRMQLGLAGAQWRQAPTPTHPPQAALEWLVGHCISLSNVTIDFNTNHSEIMTLNASEPRARCS